jgi:sulfhydrogenase subunit beta (sulfur reductase)
VRPGVQSVMKTRSISRENLAALVADLVQGGTEVVAPARASDGKVDYRRVAKFDEATWNDEMPRRSLKEFFLPPTEALFSWKQQQADITLEPVSTQFGPKVILGARPCDTAGVAVLDKVMGWDYRDELWFGRREATTIISLACSGVDDSCFCRVVGLSPDTEAGADLVLYPADGGFLAKPVTEKGETLISAHAARFADAPGGDPGKAATAAPASVGAGGISGPVDLGAVHDWLADHFENPLWEAIAFRCHGCGACASVCPTCHCFDIVDEPEGITEGTRRRNWDTCQEGRFTLHASGHNPRAQQNARFRQRVMHKFYIYPEKFGETLCTGCGRCVRACPGGMDLPEIVSQIAALATKDGVRS